MRTSIGAIIPVHRSRRACCCAKRFFRPEPCSSPAGPRGWRQARGRRPAAGKDPDVRFRNPVYPGDEIVIDVKKKEAMGGFTMMSGAIKKADGTRVLSVDFSVAWKAPEGQVTS